jgi:hypothetical protein
MKSRLEPVNAFVFRVAERSDSRKLLWDYTRVCRAIRERDRQWERMLAALYKESRKK